MYRPIISPRANLTLAAGSARTPAKLVNGARNSGVFMVARATVQVSVAAATTLRNRGSVWALFDRIYLNENGTDKSVIKGNVLRFASEMNAPSALTASRAAVGIATYQLEEAVYLQFADPLSLDPLETAYVEKDTRQDFSVQFDLAANLAARLFTVGPATVAVTNVTVSVEQDYEMPTQGGIRAPLFIPIIVEQIEQITGSVSAQPIYLRTTNLIRKVIISQEDSVLGEVPDVLTALALKGDFRDIIGPTPMDLDDLQLRGEFYSGGAVVTSNRAHVGFNFQRYGQLSEALNPVQDANLRLQVTALPSVLGVAAGGTSSLRITRFELFRDPAVVAPKVPFGY
jgi:hypothetical protein